MSAEYERWRAVLSDEPLPCAVVDLDVLERNAELLRSRLADGVTLRVASKSIRIPEVMRRLLAADAEGGNDAKGRFRGLMTYSASETALLAREGFDDLLLAYPFGRPHDAAVLAELAAGGTTVFAAVDHADHVRLLSAAARAAGTTIRLCLDVDVSWRPLGQHFGVRRSPIRSVADAMAVARVVEEAEGVEIGAVLAYEAQVAGLQDRVPGKAWMGPVISAIKARSRPLAAVRRRAVVAALREAGHAVEVVNGGGTGSVASSSADGTCTEVTAGSGFLCPHLFDGYAGLPLEPAAFFALAVVRTSDPDHVTCGGGGYVASGAAGPDRLPKVHLPKGLVPLGMEGFGEVQTPLRVTGPRPAIGDPILCRHAKGGELAERFAEVLLVRGDTVEGRAKTYRGLGGCFM